MTEQSNKTFFQKVGHFLTTPFVVKNCLSMVILVVLCFFITFKWMKCYTRHGESLQVPDYKGMQVKDAIKKAKARNFNLVVSDSISRPDLPPLEIISQTPKALSRVKTDRTIYLLVAKAQLDTKRLPSLRGNYNYAQYSANLSQIGLKTKIKERQFDWKQAENTILYMYYDGEKITQDDIENGVDVEDGATIEFVVTEKDGGGGDTFVDMPELVCQTLDEARFQISNYNLNVGSIIEDATVTNQESAYVWKQIPAYVPGETIRVGSQIDLHLTQYRPDDCQ